MEDRDWQLRVECLRISAREQLEDAGRVTDTQALFQRTKDLYDCAVGDFEFLGDWKSIWDKKPTPTKPKKDGFKKCPVCGELVPNGWKEHKYKKDGTKCGHQF